MASIDFPNSPTDGQTFTSGNATYTYIAAKGYWDAVTTTSGIQLTSLSVGAENPADGDGAISYDNTTGVFTYTPPVISAGGIALTDLSVGAENPADGDGAISYDNTTGVFTYTPPVSTVPTTFTDITTFGTITENTSSSVLVPEAIAGLLAEQAKIQASDKIEIDYFGWSVSISSDGNTAIVGAWGKDTGAEDAGAAYIFVKSGSTWTQQAKIQASDKQLYDNFGFSVSISGDGNTAIVGAMNEDTGGSNAGAAYIFTRSGTSWAQQAKIQQGTATTTAYFGYSVGISSDGNTAIVGAYNETQSGPPAAGAAYIFTRSGSTWSQQAKILASDAEASDEFGRSVSISGDGNTAIVSAPYEDTGGSNAGAAYIFVKSGTSWTHQAKIQATDKEASDEFGWSVSISSDGNTAIVGAYFEDTGGSNAGAAYIFTRSGTSWSQQAKIQASDAEADDRFGWSVSISSEGNTAIVGARNEGAGAIYGGAAYIFVRSDSTWTETQKILASDAEVTDVFGYSVSISGDGNTAIVGAAYEDTGGSNAGAAYMFEAEITVFDISTYDISQNSIFTHSGLTENITANFINVPTTNDRTIEVSLVIEQGTTGYLPTAIRIDGEAQTFVWENGTTPDPSINASDIVKFTLIRTEGAWTVLASLTRFTDAAYPAGGIALTDFSVGAENPADGDGAISYDNTTGVFTYTPPVISAGGIALTDLSVGAEGTASGDGAIAYDNTTGVFTYTPPVISSGLPSQTGNSGAFLTTDGSAASWDPLVTTTKSLAASTTLTNPNAYNTPALDHFGSVVVTDGTYLATSAMAESRTPAEGIVYVYNVTTNALVHTIEKATPDDYTYYGSCLSLADGYLAVGMDTGYSTFNGTVEIFNIATGSLVRTLTYSTAYYSQWGMKVATKNAKVLISASRFNTPTINGAGFAQLYDITTGNLIHTFDNPSPALNDYFGEWVEMTDDYIIISARSDDTISTDNGVVYVYDATSYALLHTLYSSDTSASKRFGSFFSTKGTLLAVAGWPSTTNQTVDIFNLTTGVIEFTIPVPAGIAADSRFGGSSLHINDDYIFVGAGETAVGGTLYVYNKSGAFLETIDNPNSDPTSSGDKFTSGSSALSGENLQTTITSGGGKLFIGTPDEQFTSFNKSGVVYSWDMNTTRTFSENVAFTGAVTIGGVAPLALTDLSVGAEGTASGDGAIAYDNTTGVFTYTPPVISSGLPSQTGNSGAFLTTDGSAASWDPLVSTSQSLASSLEELIWSVTAGDAFGQSIATDGTAVAILQDASDTANGRIQVFNAATRQHLYTITPPSSTPFSNLSAATIAMGGGYIVAAKYADTATAGVLSVFDSTNGSFVRYLTQPVTPSGFIGWAENALSTANGKTIVGAQFGPDGNTPNNTGVAYLFSNTTGAVLHTFNNPNPTTNDRFGATVAITNNYILIGAPREDTYGSDWGAVYVYDANTYAFIRELTPPGPSFFGQGIFVDSTGEYVIISTSNASVNLYEIATGTVAATVTKPVEAINFPYTGAVNSNYIFLTDISINTGSGVLGRVYVFNKATGAQVGFYNNPNINTGSGADFFGTAIAATDSAVFIGARLEDINAAADSGVVYTLGMDIIRTFSDNVAFNALTTLGPTTEKSSTLTGATGVVAHDITSNLLFVHSSVAANFTANFTNVPTTDNRTTSVALIINQGGTGYLPTAVQIDGAAQTILWQDATAPTAAANATDIASFSLVRSGGAWVVLGTVTKFGSV